MKKYKSFAEKLAMQAGYLLNKRLGKIKKISYKGRMNLVTDVDTACERFILNRIKKKFPKHRIISEEAGDIGNKYSEFCWLIDPLDGTTNYAHAMPFFCVSIALLKHDKIVAGAVYDPVKDELFSASKGKGAFLNHKRISVSDIRQLDKGLLSTGFPYRFGKDMKRNIRNFTRFMLQAQAVRRPGSAALDLCYVAMGRFDGFWELGLMPWDTAAGALITQEAGGKITTFKGKPFNPFLKEIVASNSKIHNRMLRVVK